MQTPAATMRGVTGVSSFSWHHVKYHSTITNLGQLDYSPISNPDSLVQVLYSCCTIRTDLPPATNGVTYE